MKQSNVSPYTIVRSTSEWEQEPRHDMNLAYNIRQATVADVAVIAKHRAAMFRAMGEIDDATATCLAVASEAYFANAISSDQYRGWLVESDATVVAGGGMVLHQLPPRPTDINGGYGARIFNIYTEPSHRRRGLARQIMTAMLSWCQAQGIS